MRSPARVLTSEAPDARQVFYRRRHIDLHLVAGGLCRGTFTT